jgi:protein ImuB
MDRWQRMTDRQGNAPPDETACALLREGPHGPVIHATNRRARLAGVQAGARLVDMRAICPDLQIAHADLAGDRAALDRLVLWARRWCPWSVRDGDDGIILDTTGSDHLLGGEAAMLVAMETQCALLGLNVQLAVAPTWGAAWALARFGPVRAICTGDDWAAQLRPLPVAGLRLDPGTLLLLQRLGLKTFGALMDVPRLSLARRFARADLASNPLLRLDQALGKMAEPVSSQPPAPRFVAQSPLPEPILDPSPHLPALCADLCDRLQRAGLGCRRLHLTIYRTDGDISQLTVATSAPSRDAVHLQGLFRDRLEKINPGFGFDLITLEAGDLLQMQTSQQDLGGGTDDGLALAQLLDRLSARFGERAISRPALRASHIPERAEIRLPAFASPPATQPMPASERPLRLFDQPEEIRVLYAVPEGPPAQFRWRGKLHRVTRHAGPERIAPEWWHDRPGTRLRDYYKIEDQAGLRLWLYREGLHEDGRGGDPRWFVHGVFA